MSYNCNNCGEYSRTKREVKLHEKNGCDEKKVAEHKASIEAHREADKRAREERKKKNAEKAAQLERDLSNYTIKETSHIPHTDDTISSEFYKVAAYSVETGRELWAMEVTASRHKVHDDEDFSIVRMSDWNVSVSSTHRSVKEMEVYQKLISKAVAYCKANS